MTYQHKFSVAPMIDCTDRHARFFLRLISKHVLLYTEMIATGALIHGDRDRFLQFDQTEHPVAIQLGGNDPAALAQCAKMAEDYGYDEVNLNVGCPSDRVQSGAFGACLMAEPDLVAEGIAAITAAVNIPVTIKTRIGIDEQDSYEFLQNFIEKTQSVGCNTYIIHARKAWLSGLSPKQNREIPPLDYQRVYQLKNDYPQCNFILNGGLSDLAEAKKHLEKLDGVMLGREAYHNPYLLAQIDQLFYNDTHEIPTRNEIVQALIPYIEKELAQDICLHKITRHILGLFQGIAGAKKWRRYLSEETRQRPNDINVLKEALQSVL